MGKPKKGKKGHQDDDFSDSEVVDPVAAAEDDEVQQPASKPAAKKGKKGRKKKDDDWEDDVAKEIAALAMEQNQGNDDITNGDADEEIPEPVKKTKKKTRKGAADADDESPAPVSAFAMLNIEDPESGPGSDADDSPSEAPSIKEKAAPVKQAKKSKKDKKKQKQQEQEDDLDAILAELDKPVEKPKSKKDKKKQETEEKQNNETDVIESETKVDDSEHKENDDNETKMNDTSDVVEVKEPEPEEDVDGDDKDDDGDEGGFKIKTAAQKKKEKKEREKKKKAEQKAKEASKKSKASTPAEEAKVEEEAKQMTPDADATATAKESTPTEEATKETTAADDEAAEGEKDEGGEEESSSSKKKKDKKKKKKKGEEKEEKKKPGRGQLAAMKEALQRVREEEERLQREEEERIKREEEELARKIEEEKQEKERKERKKLKEKEKKDRLKAEGKLLTNKQKEAQRRAQQMLESMKAQGLELPSKEDIPKRKPIYGKKKKQPQQVKTDEKSPSPTGDMESSSATETPNVTPAQTPVEEKDIAGSWDQDEDEPLDDWEKIGEEETKKEEPKAVTVTVEPKKEKVAIEAKTTKTEEDDDEDEDNSEEDSDDEDSSDDEESDSSDEEATAREKAISRIMKRHTDAEKKRTTDKLRAPVVCVLGHVDTGKTKILDKLRRTNVQDGEAGGITQQIGATNCPASAIKEKTSMCKEFAKKDLKIPGLLIIDTPGHESFSNLRTRGSGLCDIAILVVDIMHGIEPQTIESIGLLKSRKTPFIVALNKIDRLYGWKPNPHSDVQNCIKKQGKNTRDEFEERVAEVVVQFAEQSLNATLFYDNKNPREFVSMVPTSAHSGDGMGNLVALICELCQSMLAKKLSYSEELQATVMEVKEISGLGTTLDVILVNGNIREGDTIVVAGTQGPIVTSIRGCLLPPAMKELRVKNQYEHHKDVTAAQGVKIIAKDLEKAVAGLPLHVAHFPDEIEIFKEELDVMLEDILKSIKTTDRGVFVQASTLGSLEALLEFLRTSKIPYAGINIGPIHKKDVMKASVMLEHDTQYAVILAFDIKVEREAQEMADNLGVKIFTADIIYHLFDKFMAFREELKNKKREELKYVAVFPCKLRVLPQFIFNSRDPIVCGISIEAGFIKIGTPLCVPSREFTTLGRISSIELNNKPIDIARKGQEVCIKIENTGGGTPQMFGRHFDETDLLVSKISRESIDAVKDYFREDMLKTDWVLIKEMKKLFEIL
ncbi:unnamed protein product [Owenia fusiformis]|uniref:Eukaryotic translation initiation factor 5B n=1 Tax=Owenia fusiformis TaxID=6347 RepID=A0A8S4N904_OWEFU|nr:unnamed protein product [Owenia fusiformis]